MPTDRSGLLQIVQSHVHLGPAGAQYSTEFSLRHKERNLHHLRRCWHVFGEGKHKAGKTSLDPVEGDALELLGGVAQTLAQKLDQITIDRRAIRDKTSEAGLAKDKDLALAQGCHIGRSGASIQDGNFADHLARSSCAKRQLTPIRREDGNLHTAREKKVKLLGLITFGENQLVGCKIPTMKKRNNSGEILRIHRSKQGHFQLPDQLNNGRFPLHNRYCDDQRRPLVSTPKASGWRA